jgi:hypothetical protein
MVTASHTRAFALRLRGGTNVWTNDRKSLSTMKGMSNDQSGDDQLTRSIIGCVFAVGNGLGIGFFEMAYENALTKRRAMPELPEGFRAASLPADELRRAAPASQTLDQTSLNRRVGPSFDIPCIIDKFYFDNDKL